MLEINHWFLYEITNIQYNVTVTVVFHGHKSLYTCQAEPLIHIILNYTKRT